MEMILFCTEELLEYYSLSIRNQPSTLKPQTPTNPQPSDILRQTPHTSGLSVPLGCTNNPKV